VPTAKWTDPKMKSKANCLACHPGSRGHLRGLNALGMAATECDIQLAAPRPTRAVRSSCGVRFTRPIADFEPHGIAREDDH
jgi:hypothetical protein